MDVESSLGVSHGFCYPFKTMMQTLAAYLHSYTLCLLRPRLMLDWLQHGIPPYGDEELPRPELSYQIGVSWALAIVQGIARLMIANVLVQLFLSYQNEDNLFSTFVDAQDGLFPYYILVFSSALDLIFFPILTLVMTEVWSFILRLYAGFLEVEGDHQDIATDITNVALSSHFFLILPVIGVFFQQLAWLYLLYVGCRHRLGASRALSLIILITPTVVILMVTCLLVLGLFYLFAAS